MRCFLFVAGALVAGVVVGLACRQRAQGHAVPVHFIPPHRPDVPVTARGETIH